MLHYARSIATRVAAAALAVCLVARPSSGALAHMTYNVPKGWQMTRQGSDTIFRAPGREEGVWISPVPAQAVSGASAPALLDRMLAQYRRQYSDLRILSREGTAQLAQAVIQHSGPKGVLRERLSIKKERQGGAVIALFWARPEIFDREDRLLHSSAAITASRDQVPARAVRSVLVLHRIGSPDGTFSIAVPAGWQMRVQSTTLGPVIHIGPSGEDVLAVWPLLPMDFLNRQYLAAHARLVQCSTHPPLFGTVFSQCVEPFVEEQLAYGSQRHTAAEASQDLLSVLGLQNANVAEISPAEAITSFELVQKGRARSVYGDLRMIDFPNPMLGEGDVSSFAFLTGCQADSNRLSAVRPTCAAVMASFVPTSRWMQPAVEFALQRYAQEKQQLLGIGGTMANGYSRDSSIISHWGSTMQQMQYEQFARSQASNFSSQQGWINALGGKVDVWNPNDPSSVFN